MDILSYSGLSDRVGAGVPDPSPGEGEDHDWCLFSIEVRNTYGLPFEVTFERMNKGRDELDHQAQAVLIPPPGNVEASTCRTVPPGSTCRCVINPIRFRQFRI